MSKQVPWNIVIYEEFSKLAMLTDFEKDILRTRIQAMTVTEQSRLFNVSESTIHRTISILKTKYDLVQPFSDKLPPRKFSKKEKYMDEH